MTHVIWDWNGTLLDDLPVVVDAVNACLRSQGTDAIDIDGYRENFTRPLNGFYELLLGRPVDDALLADLDEIFQDSYRGGVASAALNVEARDAVSEVASRGGTQSVASMLWHDQLVPTVDGFGLAGHMLALDGNRSSVGASKEAHLSDHIGRLLREFPEVRGAEMTVIGDISDDAVAARLAGVRCVLYDGGSQPRPVLEDEGVPVAGSLLEAVAIAFG